MGKPIRTLNAGQLACISINFLRLGSWQSVLGGAVESAVMFLLGHCVPRAAPVLLVWEHWFWSLGCQILLDLLYLDWMSFHSLGSMVWQDPYTLSGFHYLPYWFVYLCVSNYIPVFISLSYTSSVSAIHYKLLSWIKTTTNKKTNFSIWVEQEFWAECGEAV